MCLSLWAIFCLLRDFSPLFAFFNSAILIIHLPILLLQCNNLISHTFASFITYLSSLNLFKIFYFRILLYFYHYSPFLVVWVNVNQLSAHYSSWEYSKSKKRMLTLNLYFIQISYCGLQPSHTPLFIMRVDSSLYQSRQ